MRRLGYLWAPCLLIADPAWAANGGTTGTAILGMALVLTVIGCTIGSWRELFKDLQHGAATAVLWVLILATGPAGGLFALLFLGWVFYLHHEDLMRRFYLMTPHPAQELYDHAHREGRALDLDAFSAAVRRFDTASVPERRARAEQLDRLNAQMAQGNRDVQGRERAIMGAERSETDRDQELLQAQAAALEAAIAHERAAARYEELERARRS